MDVPQHIVDIANDYRKDEYFMKKIALLIVSAALFFNTAWAEEQDKKEVLNFGVEIGVHVLTKDVTPPENVRFAELGVHAYYIPWNIGAVTEYLFGNGMFGVGTGLRLTSYTAFYGRKTSYFEWNMRPESLEGDYVKLHNIKQSNNYLGFPVLFRMFFVPQTNVVRPYFKLDLGLNFLVVNKNTINFVEEDTPLTYVDKINENLGTPEKFNAPLDFALGLRVGKDPFYVNLEAHYPSFLLTDSPVSFFQTEDLNMLNLGVKLMIQVPIHWSEYKKAPVEEETIKPQYIIDDSLNEQQPAEDDSNGVFTPDDED